MSDFPETELHPLYTAGYTGLLPDDLLSAAQHLGALIVDIRLNARSRVPYWNKGPLQRAWGEAYRHVGELGNLNYRSGGEVALADEEKGVAQIVELLHQQPVILLCACVDWRTCHRRTAAEAVAARVGVAVTHLSADDVRVLAGGNDLVEQPPLL
ncbi:MAG: DUF488 domain-containing protein [bacterium]|nr:DUF488 domain-containing protein [bacterium]